MKWLKCMAYKYSTPFFDWLLLGRKTVKTCYIQRKKYLPIESTVL